MISVMSRVVVITTGGTIASVADDRGVLRPARTGAELLGDEGDRGVQVIDMMAKDSSQLTVADWDRIASAISVAVEDGMDGVVITHGTDTLEETALWLELTYDGAAAGAPPSLFLKSARSDRLDPSWIAGRQEVMFYTAGC